VHHRQYEGLRGTVDGGRAKVVMHNVKTAVSTKKTIAGGVPMNPGTFYVPVVYWGSPPAAPLQTSEPPPPLPPPESPLRGPGAGAKQQQPCDEPILAMDTLKARIMGAAPEDVKAIIAGVQFVPRCGRGGVRGTMKGAQAAGAGCRQVCSHSLCAGACIDTFPFVDCLFVQGCSFHVAHTNGGRASCSAESSDITVMCMAEPHAAAAHVVLLMRLLCPSAGCQVQAATESGGGV
jgi:hypothetical protein